MRIAIVDESATRATIIEEGLRRFRTAEIFVLTERRGLLARIEEIGPDVVLIDLGNPSRDVLEDYFAVSRALARPIAMFVDQSDDDSDRRSDRRGGLGLCRRRARRAPDQPVLDLAVRRFKAFARLQRELAEAKGKLAERDDDRQGQAHPDEEQGRDEPAAYAELLRKAMSSTGGSPTSPRRS